MSRINCRKIAIAGLLAFLPLVAKAETVLNMDRFDNQRFPAAARLSNAKFVVGWYSEHDVLEGHWFNIFDSQFERQFSWEGPVSVISRLSRDFVKFGASNEDESYFSAFGRWTSEDTTNVDVYACKFDNEGDRLIGDMRVNADTAGNQWAEAVIIDDENDRIMVIWGTNPDYNPDQKHYYMRHLDFELNPLTDDIPIYTGDDESIWMRDAEILGPNKLIAVFDHDYMLGHQNVIARHLDFDGNNMSELFDVNTFWGVTCYLGSITKIPDGVLILWSGHLVIYEAAIWGRRFDINGNPIDDVEILLSVPDDNDDGSVDIQNWAHAALNDQSDTVGLTWSQDKGDHAGTFKIMGRFLDYDLEPVSDTFTVSETGNARLPSVVSLQSGEFISCWQTYLPDSDYGVDILAEVLELPETGIYTEEVSPPHFLSSSYPNPFNSKTAIRFNLPEESLVTLEIFDPLGRRIEAVIDNYLLPGYHQVAWDAQDASSGMYFYRIQAGEYSETRKMVLLK